MEIGKLSVTAAIVVLTAILVALAGIGWVSLERQEPFMIYGKEFGFGSEAYKKMRQELSVCRSISEEMEANIASLEKINQTLQEQLSERKGELDAAALKNSEQWFPLDEISVTGMGKEFNLEALKSRGSVWQSPGNELSLRVTSIKVDEVLLETNLPEPYNQLRLERRQTWKIPMPKWHYKISLDQAYYGMATIRVERRLPTQ